MTLPPPERRLWLADQDAEDRAPIFATFTREYGTPWAFWQDDPVGFIEDALGEYVSNKQVEVLSSVVNHKRTAAPAAHSVGKTHSAARLVAYWVCTNTPGEALVVTTATRWRQVRQQLWPHILRLGEKHGFPGVRNQTEWTIDRAPVATGFAPNDYDEAASSGWHAPNLLVIVDEAGGISPMLGDNLNNSLSTGKNTRLLAIGNPPTDDEGAWFETICSSSLWNTIPIPAFATPNFTGEPCPTEIAAGLVDQAWVDDVAHQYGVDSSYYIARVLAQFPKVFATKVIPTAWLEAAMENENPVKSDWQRLGVDVAGDGGDEMVVAWADGNVVTVAESWANADSADQVANAERVLEWIRRAQGRQRQKGYTGRKVRVKIDNIGIGAGTADILARMGKDEKHDADIVRVDVRERASDADRFGTRRAECWWNLRELVRDGTIALHIDGKVKAQLAGPTWRTDNTGRTVIESKDAMKRRGLASPDQADAISMSVYEPDPVVKTAVYGHQLLRERVPVHVSHRN